MRVVGTAGHVDHGKSTLIAALTGTHPDRLKEERAREMTIDLGFASMQLPGGEIVGIVDVPGHRDFIENMLAGVGGIDAALFVVAADEGVMPQTREHLAILDILQVQGGVIVLTKIDLIDDPEWLDLVEADVRQAVEDTILENAPIVRVSAKTRVGLPELIHRLEEILMEHPSRPDLGRPRLPVDRVFSMPGFGTVVTGTLTDGSLKVGDEVDILPIGLHGRIRGLQTHNQKEETAVPGSRTAVNISGVNMDQIQRGAVIALPGRYEPSRWLDVQFRLLADASGPLKHSSEVKLFLGTSETLARVRLLGVDELVPGQVGWLQLELRDPVVALRGDHYILRRPSPGETLGGGIVIDPHPKQRHKRFSTEVLAALEAMQHGTPEELIVQASMALGIVPLRDVVKRARVEADQAAEAINTMISSGGFIVLEDGAISPQADLLGAAFPVWNALATQAVSVVRAYHLNFPLRKGIPREELKSRLKLPARTYQAAVKKLVRDGVLVESGAFLQRPGFTVVFNPQQQEKIRGLLQRFAADPFSPPSIKDCQASLGEDLYTAVVDSGELVPVSSEVVFRKEEYDTMLAEVQRMINQEGSISLAQFRDRFSTSRKYAQAFLEHLDQVGVTVRVGDLRKLKQPG